MKLRECVVLVLATTLMGAAPPAARQPTEPPTPWGKLKAGALRLLPGSSDDARPLPATPQPAGGTVGAPPARRDPRVRPATAVQAEPRRRSLFGRERRPRRTLSEYMAWEKP